ncbi:MAG: PAS domain S-box protein [Rhodothermaceae bacterium]|nr:PAS domain S-box protein [Rhodothermaceae bacterium]
MSLPDTAQRDQFRALLDDLPMGVSAYRLDDLGDARSLRLVYSNAAAGRLTGLDPEEEVGRLLTEIAPGAWETGLPEQYAEVVRTGAARDFGEIVYEDERIRRAVYSVRAQPLPDQSVSIVFEDVTERHELNALRKAQDALAETEAQYRFLSEFLHQQIWTAQPDGHLDYVNRYILDYFGRTEEEMIGAGWQDVVHADDLPTVVSQWTHSLETGEPYEVEFRLRRAADGDFRWHLGRAHALKDDEGQVAKWFGTNTDVHAHKTQAQTLADSEARAQALFHAVTDVVLVYPIEDGKPGPLRMFNEAALRLYGYSEDELATMTVSDLLAPGAPSVDTALERIFRESRATFQSVHKTREGRRVSMETNARLLELGDQLYVFAVCRDVTERRESEREILRLNLQLEQRVAERTERLEHLTETLAERERQLLNAQQLARVGSWSWNAQTDQVEWSEVLYDVLGLAPDDFEPSLEGYLALLPEEDREHLGGIVQAALQTGEPYALEHRLVRPDGSLRHISSRGEAILGEEGEGIGLRGIAQDVSERVEAERELRRTHMQLQLIVDSAADGIYGLDLRGHTTFVNAAAVNLTGWSAEEMLDRPQHDVIHHHYPDGSAYPREVCPIYQVMQDGEARQVKDEVFWRKDGTALPVQYTSAPLFDGDTIVGAVVVFRAREHDEADA